MNLQTKIRIESKDQNVMTFLLNHIYNEFISRKYIFEKGIIKLIDQFIAIGDYDIMNYIEFTCSGIDKNVIIPMLIDRDSLSLNDIRFKAQDILIKITPQDNNLIPNIGNMIYEQFVGHEDYIENLVILNIDNEEYIEIFIDSNSTKVPMFFLTKFYSN